jgi:penicillin-binding protein 2
MKKGKVDPKMRKSSSARNKDYRFFLLAGVFLALTVAFVVFFAINQAKGTSGKYTSDGLIVRVETVAGERGRIYDRNGKLLVGNATHYDLIFEYGSMPDRRAEVNDALLECLEALAVTGNAHKRVKDHFPLVRTDSGYEFSSEFADGESNVAYYYSRFLEKNPKLQKDASAAQVVEYICDKYSLAERFYSADAIYELMRIYYDMERINFGYYQAYTLAEDFETTVPDEMALISYIAEHRTEGATLIRSSERVYYYEGYAEHILGKLGKISAENIDQYKDYPLDATVGISGCEKAFESYLRGSDGKRVSKYDADGNLVEQYYDPAPVVGNDVYLTIDIDLQVVAEDELRTAVDELDASETGALTAIDPDTGETLVIASHSTESSMNFALQGAFAPGSTYKVGSALAALEQGFINSSTTHVCNHVYPHLGGPTCLGNHGVTDVHKAIEVSCNIFFYYLGHEWGLNNITDFTTRLGLGVPTGIELGESVGIVASEGYCDDHDLEWSEFDDATGAIGQSKHAYTPLQLSVYMATVSNGGTRYSAHILKEVKTRTGETVVVSAPTVVERISISDANYDTLMGAMKSVVDSSSALSSYFGNLGVSVAGKTGTAETGREVSNALFSGFAPSDDPKIVVTCVLEEGDAGTNAAKVTAKVFEAYFDGE